MSIPDELLQSAIEAVNPSISIHDVKIALPWRKQTPAQRAESFLGIPTGLLVHSGEVHLLAQDLKDALAEVERLREAARQVHALSEAAVAGTAVGAWLQVQEIHKITKGMVK